MAKELDLSEFGGTPELDLSEFFGAQAKTEKPEQGLISSLGSELWQGAKSAGRSVLATGNTAVSDLSEVEQLAKSQKDDAVNDSLEKKALLSEIERRKKLNPEAGWTDAVKDVAGAAWDNKTGTAQMVASQLPNSAVALGGAWAGGKAGAAAGAALGSVVPGIGTAIGGVAGGILGGLTGMFLGNFALETGGKAMDKAGDGFTQQEANDSLTEGAKKAAVITGVDALTFGAGKLATRAFVAPAVRAGARAEAKVLVDAGVDITDGASIAAALANAELRTAAKVAGEAAAKAASSTTRRAGNAATGLTMETVGEGVGEYYGEEAATGNGDVYDAALESISSLSQSAFQTARAMRESGVQGLDPGEILKVQLNESAAKPGSVLSRATVAANPELKIEPIVEPAIEPTIEPAPIDPVLAQRLADAGRGASFDGLPAGETSPLINELEDDGTANGLAPGDPVGAGLPAVDTEAGLGAGPGPVARPGADAPGPAADAVVPAAGLPIGPVEEAVAPIAGDAINKTWTEFHPASGTLNIPRKEMPQIKSEHRGAMTNFLAARGVTGAAETVEASSLKPTQREFSPDKVKQALNFKGNDRPVLVSSDGHILDGHHQWMAKAQQEAPVKITRLSAPIAELLTAMKEFPSAGMTKDAEPFSQPQGKTNVAQAPQAFQAEKEGQEAPTSQLKLVLAPQNVAAEPASASNPGNALVRLRRAQVQRMAQAGFTQIETRGGQTLMVNPARNEAMVVTGGPVAVALAQRAIAAQAPAVDNVALGQTNGSTGTTGTGLDQGRAGAAGTSGEDGAGGIAPASARDGRGLAGGAAANPGQADSGPAGVARVVAQNQTLVSDSGAKIANHQATLARQLAAETNPARRIALSAEIAALPKMGQPPADVLQSFAEMASNWAQTMGTEAPVAYWDDSPTASDGFEQFGRTHVNLSKPTMALQWTIAHESDHSQEKTASPQEEALRTELWNQVTPEGRKIFFEGFLYRGKKFAQATPAELMRLRSEMLAEFQGGRFTDAAWLEKLAQQKPGLFGRFVAEWIPTLTRTIAALKSRYAIGDTTSKKSVDKFMKDLEKAKDIAMKIAILWAEKNQGLAQKSGLIETAADVQYARRVGPKHSNLTDDYLVPESAIWQDSTGNLINLPPLTFKGLNRSYPSAPVRIRIGRHGDETNPLTGHPYGQYGLQHRVSNETETSVKKYRVDGDKTDAQQWADLAVRDLMVGLMAGRSLYAQQDAAKLGVWSPDPGGQTGLWTILQYATDKETGEKFWDVQTVTPRSAKWVADNHRNNAPLPMSGFTFDGLDAQTSSGLAVRTLNELRAPTPIPPSAETMSVDAQGQVVNPRTAAPMVPVAQKPVAKLLARDANGKIILNKNKVQLSLRDELQAELDAEMNGVQVADIKTIMAEEAYPPVAWREAKGSMGTQYVADIGGAKGQERLEMNEDSRSGLWDLGFPGTWVGPAMGESDGYASKKAVQAFAQRQAAAYDLWAKGFDLASTLDKQQQYDLLDAWKTMERVPAEGSVNGAHKYAGIQAASQSLKDIANDMGITQDYDLSVVRDLPDRATVLFTLAFKHKASGAEFGAMLEQHQEGGKRFLTANTLEMGKGGLGAAFYQLAAEYAARRNLVLRPESALSGINSYRRTEQQLSAALRTGKSNVMVPHRTQRVYGFEDNASRKESHDANIVRLILAGLRNAKELVKDFAKLRYVPETGTFTDAKGKNKEAAVQKLLADVDARAFGMGRSTLARALLTQQLLEGAKTPESFKEPILYSARDTAAVEYQAVIDQYQNTDAWMKAPNGSPTLLTERQWVQVRTPSFAAWFGPWQEYGIGAKNGTVWNDDKGLVSKAIDENGEPLVVYHGTDKGGFMAFSQPGGEKRGDLGIFTTPNRDMASSYVRKGREQDLTPPTDAERFAELGMLIEDYEGRTSSKDTEDRTLYRYETPNGDEVGPFETEADAMRDALAEYGDTYFEPKSGIYGVFMNIRNPNEEDFEGALWSGSREHLWQVVDADGETRESDGKIYMEEDEARALAKTLADEDDEYEGADFMQPASDHWNDTDDVVREAVRMKHDGAIIRNVIDDGGGLSSYDNEPSDVFVALKPEMVKSADFNTGEFGLSRDLRYSKRDTSDINPKVLEAIPEVAKLAAYLTPTEKSKLRVDTAQKMVDLHEALPSSDEMAAVAYAGKAKRFWYRNSLSAIAHVFGQDGWRFTGLLAATSPQCSVETNLLNALNTWKNWVAAGRPTTKEEIVAVMGRSVQGNKGEDSVLNAWINNAVSALTAKDFADLVLSGPKVDSFMRNLLGHYYEVTNDAWIANYTLMDQKIFSGSKNKAGTEPGKGPGYLAMNAQTRKAAKKLGWQPAEVQETVWSWAMSMLETMDKQGETRGSKELLADGAMTDELINRTPDFRSLFHLPVYANILEQAGYHDALADLVAPHTVEDHGPMPFEQKKMDKMLHQAGLRLEFLQRQRRTNVQLSWEARPGESTGILPGIHAAPIELQQQYLADIYAAIESAGFYDKTGLSLRNTLFGPGAWQGKVLPGAQSLTRPGIVADNKGGLMVDPESRAKINAAASVLGIVLNQEGVYWHYPIYRNGNEEFDNGVEIDFGRSLTNDEMSRLYGAIIKKAGHTDWAPANTPTGVRVLNFSETANKSFHKVIQSAARAFAKSFDGDSTDRTFSSDGDALENNWKGDPDGQAYKSRISQAGRSDLLGWISDVLQPAIDQINRRYSDEHGWGTPTRGDIQRSAREGGPGDRRRPSDAATVQFSDRDGAGWRPGSGAEDRQSTAQRSSQTGRGTGQDQGSPQELTPLPGAPNVPGFHGPDPRLVAVAQKYAADNGITLKRQAEYVQIDEARAKRIAAAYEAMPHAPSDPKVKAAFDNLIQQTIAQYRALADAGYRFWFMDMAREDNQQYASSPWNAMRDIRANKTMGVFPTREGYGSNDTELDVADNPMLADTGIQWPVGNLGGAMQPVLANDLFRAVHDAFGHGLEGAGFRAQGEENAWQAHARLFTGSAVGAITSETRGQNSWLNYGPKGEANRAAKVEDTVFADQKTGLMPEWTWTEGVASDKQINRSARDAATVRAAVHFGQRAGLSQLSGLSNGTGIRGAEDQRLKEATDPRIKRRVYFYSPVTGGIPQPEAGLGGNVYQADLDNLYDPSTATRPLSGSGNAFESSVLDAGYNGYLDPTSGVIVMLGQDVPVKHMGSISDFKLIPRVAKQVKLKTQTTVSGDELSRKPEPAELSGLIKNKAAIAKAAPSFRFEYGYARVKQSESVAFDQVMSELGSSFRFTPEAVNLVTADSLPNSKMTVNKTLAQRADTLRELIACLA